MSLRPPRARPSLWLDLQSGARAPACPVDRAQLRRWILPALESDARLTVRFVGRAEGQSLNRDFRGRDYPTNVLTFDYPAPEPGTLQADVVLCLPVVREEAGAQGKRYRDHLAHLLMHGVLHAQGYDHVNSDDAIEMEARERVLLRRFRIADPYREQG